MSPVSGPPEGGADMRYGERVVDNPAYFCDRETGYDPLLFHNVEALWNQSVKPRDPHFFFLVPQIGGQK